MRKHKMPSREQLDHLLKYATIRSVAKLLEVSKETVFHWVKFYDIKCLRKKQKDTTKNIAIKRVLERGGKAPVLSGYIGENYGV